MTPALLRLEVLELVEWVNLVEWKGRREAEGIGWSLLDWDFEEVNCGVSPSSVHE